VQGIQGFSGLIFEAPVLIENLLRRGVDPSAKSDASSLVVPEGLEFIEATAMDVAKVCGNRRAYKQALEATAIRRVQ